MTTPMLEQIRRDFDMGNKALWERAPEYVEVLLGHLAAERRRREEVERELARVRGLPELEWAKAAAIIAQGLALHARTDQPAAKRMMQALDDAKTYVGNLQARAERAEADNAALLEALREVRIHACTELGCMPCFKRAQAEQSPHPGAALLERMRALEEAVNAARIFGGNSRLLADAIAKADALKVSHE